MARAVRTFSGTVLPEWGDYNNHLNEGYYGVIFGHASDGLLDLLGFGADYRENENGTYNYSIGVFNGTSAHSSRS